MLSEIVVWSLLIASTISIVSWQFKECQNSFYQGEPPLRFFGRLQTDKRICEYYKGQFYFATEYDPSRKIPIYSAYAIDVFQRANEILRPKDKKRRWRKAKDLTSKEQPFITDYKGVQAERLNRGHLATRFFFPTNDGRKSTDVLTNIALQYELFNRFTWFKLETLIYLESKTRCSRYGGVSYFVTGVIPSSKPPFKEKINIPSDFWTAVCCDTSNVRDDNDKTKGWSFAYIAENINSRFSKVDLYSVHDFLLDYKIQFKYAKIFKDIKLYTRGANQWVRNCLFDPAAAGEIMVEIENYFRMNNNFNVHRSNPLLRYELITLPPTVFRNPNFQLRPVYGYPKY